MFTISTFADEDPEDWAAFVEACPEAWLNHRPETIQGNARQCSFALKRQGRIAAICVISRVRDHLAWVFDGPGVAVGPGEDAEAAYQAVGEELRERARQWRCVAVRFDLPMLAPANLGRCHARSALAEMGFSSGLRPSNRVDYAHSYHSIVDLRQEMDQILKGFSRGNRNSVTRALKRHFAVNFTCGTPPTEAEWEGFVRINRVTFARSHFPGFSAEYLGYLREQVGGGHLMLMDISDAGECIAAELLEVYKGGVNCLAGGATDEARRFGITPFSMYSAMRWAKENGCHSFNLGSTFPSLNGTRHGSIGDSKKRFGGVRYDDLSGECILDLKAHFCRVLMPRMVHKAFAEFVDPNLLDSVRKLRRLLKRRHAPSPAVHDLPARQPRAPLGTAPTH